MTVWAPARIRAFSTLQGAVVALITVALLLTATSCGGPEKGQVYPELDEQSRMSVLKAQDRQRAMGVQIQSIASKDSALDFCFEMCNRAGESCNLSNELCQYSKKFSEAVALVATCRFSREQCRRHRSKVPRQCNCIWDE